jgi:hypothetical protein
MEPIPIEQDDSEQAEFSILIKMPRSLVDLIEAEAKREQRSRARQIIRSFEERYGLVEATEETQRLSA